MTSPLIEFICIAAAHKPQRSGEHASTVTVHQGRWAYCDSPAEAGHDWVASGGTPLALLRHRPVERPVGRTSDRAGAHRI